MSGRYLLDTNIVIALFAGEAAVQQHLATANEVFVPSIVLGELYYGAYNSGRAHDNSTRVADLAAASTILGCDNVTAHLYGRIKHRLRAKGRPLPENDIWIAAITDQHKLTLVSRDRHFDEIDNIIVEAW